MCNNERKPHIHAQQIKAWADGHTIEYWSRFSNKWTVTVTPTWALDTKYRIQPEQSDFEKYGVEVGDVWSTVSLVITVKEVVDPLDSVRDVNNGALSSKSSLRTLLFRRGVVDKL